MCACVRGREIKSNYLLQRYLQSFLFHLWLCRMRTKVFWKKSLSNVSMKIQSLFCLKLSLDEVELHRTTIIYRNVIKVGTDYFFLNPDYLRTPDNFTLESLAIICTVCAPYIDLKTKIQIDRRHLRWHIRKSQAARMTLFPLMLTTKRPLAPWPSEEQLSPMTSCACVAMTQLTGKLSYTIRIGMANMSMSIILWAI